MDVVNRTFVGIRVPEAISEQIVASLFYLKRKAGTENVRWSPPGEYLIQLASLGELAPATLGILQNVLAPVAAKFPPMRLEVAGFAGLPNAVQPRYAYAALEGDTDGLEPLAQAIDHAAAPYVPVREGRSFRPQVIVGRLKTESEAMRVALGRALKMTAVPSMGTLRVDAIELLISKADPSGICYSPIDRFPLRG